MRWLLACSMLLIAGCAPRTSAPLPPTPEAPHLLVIAWQGTFADIGVSDLGGRFAPRLRVADPSGYGVRVRLSPDGNSLAVVTLNGSRVDSKQTGILQVGTLTDGLSVLATGVDAQSAPVWSPSGDAVAFRKAGDGRDEIWSVTLATGEMQLEFAGPEGATMHLIGWPASGMAYQIIRPDVSALHFDGTNYVLNGVARDCSIAPDGERMACSVYSARTSVALVGEAGLRLISAPGTFAHPAWRPDGGLTVASRADGREITIDAGGSSMTAIVGPVRAFGLPSVWSPDGRNLAARVVRLDADGQVVGDALSIVGADGRYTTVQAPGYLEAIGWRTY